MGETTCMPFVSELGPVCASGVLYLCVCLSVHVCNAPVCVLFVTWWQKEPATC